MTISCLFKAHHDDYMGEPACLLKLDISKAFDTVDWAFLIQVLIRMGFGRRWTTWICGLFSTATTRVLVNGVPGRTICHVKGMRQGDSLSPMLFILAMEALQHMFRFADNQGMLTPLARRGLTHRLSFFADDVMLFLKPTANDIAVCAAILEDFGNVAGLRVNASKCSAIPIRCTDEMVNLIHQGLGYPITTFPIKYLGLPISLRKQSAAQFKEIVEGVIRKLPNWRAADMDKAGCLILVQSVLCAMPIHAMLALDVPPKVLSSITRVCRSFFCAGSEDA